ncbi:MAG: type II toxin-antitoxin system CcdA family antitoxin [Solirubrobacterales bacterium]|nr:type II toxin-antitoxin system CcdA family antitoxin [Solirubrobacterales bacterium]
MASRTTVTLDDELANRARELDINISAAARAGIADAVHAALAQSDREAYLRHPEGGQKRKPGVNLEPRRSLAGGLDRRRRSTATGSTPSPSRR